MTTQHIHTYCAMCVSRCGVVATVEDGLLQKVTADPVHPNGCICVNGTAAPEIVYAPDHLQYSMKRTQPKGDADPGWVRISWNEALELRASRLLDIKTQCGAEAVVFGIGTPAGNDMAGGEQRESAINEALAQIRKTVRAAAYHVHGNKKSGMRLQG